MKHLLAIRSYIGQGWARANRYFVAIFSRLSRTILFSEFDPCINRSFLSAS